MISNILRITSTIYILLLISCSHFSTKVHLTEKEKDLYSSVHDSMKRFKGIEGAEKTHVLIYRNWEYTGLWNDLESWKTSQELFRNVCVDYWKIPSENIKTVEHDRAGMLEYYLKNFKGERLIIYFVSHQDSKGNIILNNGSEYPTRRFADRLNELDAKTMLIFDTCYAEYLTKLLKNKKVSAYYGSPDSKEAYDFRPRGQKPTLDETCEKTRKFIKAAWGMEIKSASPFGFYMVQSLLEDSYEGYNISGLMASVKSFNRKMRNITGLGRYPTLSWIDTAGWGNVVIR
ncbi:MAG: hypothetical protein NE327_14165 [Lentisphaeraceae bacterium]|nr:hypothetical protein [Lentisphaeraceae bacterium]